MNRNKTSKTIILFLGGVFVAILLLMPGCALGPNYHRPATNPPENFRFAGSPSTNSLGDMQWQAVFQDPILQNLITIALTNNYNLKQAVDRVEEARYNAMAARSPFFPQVSYGGDVGRGRNSLYNAPISLGGLRKVRPSPPLTPPGKLIFGAASGG